MKRILSKIMGNSKCASKVENNIEVAVEPDINVNDELARLVVVGNESIFPDSVVNYGLEMAQRMNYQIIALNTAPLSCNTFRILQDTGNQMCMEFRENSCQSVLLFEKKAKEKSISFTHVVKFVETDDALEYIRKELGEIRFVVSEPEYEQTTRQFNKNENRMTSGICVYSMR